MRISKALNTIKAFSEKRKDNLSPYSNLSNCELLSSMHKKDRVRSPMVRDLPHSASAIVREFPRHGRSRIWEIRNHGRCRTARRTWLWAFIRSDEWFTSEGTLLASFGMTHSLLVSIVLSREWLFPNEGLYQKSEKRLL